ncbi:PilT protein domain protein OS=Calothrix sp. PCC 7507 GN=Cal7507_4864 PE=4 SV=1 [Gemmataceae bacterium]|nr:PilT protein domain protein OS=Calothrix sp. PCC 7507 GN=Cal7507_4864 PE=4 SV=1 [Gemmataceae bacterium]VTU01363.1 PilT protein domain protein OS=Calothrix sp. PCC 7507 GN=Cal7507_4864 PE=4 SV=1 [Gemmataceae bacterium]
MTHLEYKGRNLLDFDEAAAAVFRNLKAARVRIGTMDLRIASIVLAHDATLITMNVRDYE